MTAFALGSEVRELLLDPEDPALLARAQRYTEEFAGVKGIFESLYISLINRSIQDVKTGTESTDLAVSAMQVIGECIQSIKGLMDEIAAASVQQAGMMALVENGIKEISTVVQTNSAAAEKSAAVSKELSSQARTLNNLISRFRVG